jgi:hypothetical protein
MATGNDLGSSPITAALTLSLTGPFARQGTEATEGCGSGRTEPAFG